MLKYNFYYFQGITIIPLRTFSAQISSESASQSTVNANVPGLSRNVVDVPNTRKTKTFYKIFVTVLEFLYKFKFI